MVCNKAYSGKSGNRTLENHLQLEHPGKYKEFLEKKKKVDTKENANKGQQQVKIHNLKEIFSGKKISKTYEESDPKYLLIIYCFLNYL